MSTIEDTPKKAYNNTLLWYCCGVSWGVAAYGYGASIIATTMGQPTWLSEMGLDTASNASELLGAANALYFVGGVLGCLIVAAFADKYGRKPMIGAGATIMLISTAVLAGAVDIGTFMAFRLTAGVV
jgi:MFS family permease